MSLVHVNMTAKTPLSFRKGRDLAQAETLDYVPGNALLGALAEIHLSSDSAPNQFADFFLSGAVQYANLYPANFHPEVLQSAELPVLPLPLTARSCKRFSGFRFDAEEEIHHGVTDALIPLLLFSLDGKKNHDIVEPVSYCPVCADRRVDRQEPLTHFLGYYRCGPRVEQIGRSDTKDNHGLRTRTGINYETRTAAQGIFYSREVLLEGSQFYGAYRVNDSIQSSWESFVVEKASKEKQIRVGNNRSRGFGLVELNLDTMAAETNAMIETRVRKFNEALQARAKEHAVNLDTKLYVPITLTSDAILYDNLLRPRLNLDEEYLSNRLGLAGSQVALQITGVRRITGWSVVWRMPKPDDLALTMGSVFVLALPEDSPQVIDQLRMLQEAGIGSRRCEGFGQLRVASEFHYEHFEVEGGFR